MMQQTALTQDRSLLASSSRRFALVIGATAFVALCAHISIPLGFTPVPITLQPFAVLLLIKTQQEKVEAVRTRVHELHSYEVPEFLVLDVADGSSTYLDWIASSVAERRP